MTTQEKLADRLASYARRHVDKPSLRWTFLKLFVEDCTTWDEVLDKEPVDPTVLQVLGIKEKGN
jgi:hypothetical protein